MRLVFIGLTPCSGSKVSFPEGIECCEEDGACSRVSLLYTQTRHAWPGSAATSKLGASEDLIRYGSESLTAARGIAALLALPDYRAVSSNVIRDRKLLRSLLGLVGAACPPLLDLAAVQRAAVTSIFRDRPEVMPTLRVIEEMISKSTEAELYRNRKRGPSPDDANASWWRWRDVQSRARMLKLGFSM